MEQVDTEMNKVLKSNERVTPTIEAEKDEKQWANLFQGTRMGSKGMDLEFIKRRKQGSPNN